MEKGSGIAPQGMVLHGAAAAEWASLASESDPRLRAEGLLSLAARQENAGDTAAAASIYAAIPEITNEAPLLARSRDRLALLQGGGTLGGHSEWLLRRFAAEAADPAMLLSMGLAGTCFRLTRLGVLSRLTGAPAANFLTRGFGARALAGVAAFALEAPTFAVSARLFHQGMGRDQDWSANAVTRDLASAYLTLGGLKLAGWAGAGLYSRFGAAQTSRAALLQGLFQQGSMLTGVLLGHGLERLAGLRPAQPFSSSLVDSLAMLLQFHVAGNLGRSFLGEGFQSWERGLDLRAQQLSSSPPPLRFRLPVSEPLLVPAGSVPAKEISPPESNRLYSMAMDGEEAHVGRLGEKVTFQYDPKLEEEWESQASPVIHYPPEIESLLDQVEEQMTRPDYYDGTRADLLRRRPDAEAIDRIWFHQAKDMFGQHPEVRVREADVDLLREPVSGVETPDVDLLQRALQALGPRGHDSSSARRVLVVDYPTTMLVSPRFGFGLGYQVNMEIVSAFGSAQQQYGVRLPLMPLTLDEPTLQVRIIAPSLFEKVLQELRGARFSQIHWVKGTIPRDTAMLLRARRVSPGGIWRNQEFLEDAGRVVFPFANTIHDVVIHGMIDAATRSREVRFSNQLYRWSQRHLASGPLAEKLRNELADLNLWGALDLVPTLFSRRMSRLEQGSARDRGEVLRDMLAFQRRLRQITRLHRDDGEWLGLNSEERRDALEALGPALREALRNGR